MRWPLFALVFTLTAALCTQTLAQTQEAFWVQIEAQPNRLEAEERARDYAANLTDVNGFSIRGGWFGIALGPFSQTEAISRLAQLRAAGQIPSDSYLARSTSYGARFWPQDGGAPTALAPATQTTPTPTQTQPQSEAQVTETVAAPEPAPEPVVPDETPRQARASESQLTRSERELLQTALQWAGFYTSAIDGAFGRGTRASMAAWQAANGFEQTGVLTTRQRAALLGQYNAVLEGMDLRLVQDPRTGISMQIPRGVVDFAAYEAPFARYSASGRLPVQVIQISQSGDQRTLFGLYDILQTLEIVPIEGPRERRNNGFSITGENSRIVSYTQASLRDGQIKGFILVWPRGDEERRTRVLDEMRESFQIIPGVLPPEAGLPDEPSVDLISGLAIRKPIRARSGVYIDRRGRVLTSTDAVAGCASLTIDGTYAADVTARNDQLGLAVLSPRDTLAPLRVAALAPLGPRLQSEVAVAGYSYEGALGAPTLTFGTLADVKGLQGETYLDRLALAALPGDTGGPVFDSTGAVIGVLQPQPTGGRQLPQDVAFATDAAAIRDMLNQAGVSPQAASNQSTMAPEDLTRTATAMTVLVSCWD